MSIREFHRKSLVGLFLTAFLMSNFISSFAPFGAIGVGQVAFAFVFERVARLYGGADLATALQFAFFLVKAPGMIPWVAAKWRTGASNATP